MKIILNTVSHFVGNVESTHCFKDSAKKAIMKLCHRKLFLLTYGFVFLNSSITYSSQADYDVHEITPVTDYSIAGDRITVSFTTQAVSPGLYAWIEKPTETENAYVAHIQVLGQFPKIPVKGTPERDVTLTMNRTDLVRNWIQSHTNELNTTELAKAGAKLKYNYPEKSKDVPDKSAIEPQNLIINPAAMLPMAPLDERTARQKYQEQWLNNLTHEEMVDLMCAAK